MQDDHPTHDGGCSGGRMFVDVRSDHSFTHRLYVTMKLFSLSEEVGLTDVVFASEVFFVQEIKGPGLLWHIPVIPFVTAPAWTPPDQVLAHSHSREERSTLGTIPIHFCHRQKNRPSHDRGKESHCNPRHAFKCGHGVRIAKLFIQETALGLHKKKTQCQHPGCGGWETM